MRRYLTPTWFAVTLGSGLLLAGLSGEWVAWPLLAVVAVAYGLHWRR